MEECYVLSLSAGAAHYRVSMMQTTRTFWWKGGMVLSLFGHGISQQNAKGSSKFSLRSDGSQWTDIEAPSSKIVAFGLLTVPTLRRMGRMEILNRAFKYSKSP